MNSDVLKNCGECLYRSTRSKIYYAIIGKNKKQIKKSLHTKDRAMAATRLRLLRAQLTGFNGEASSATLGEYALTWLHRKKGFIKPSTFLRYQNIVKAIGGALPYSLRHLTADKLADWAESRVKSVKPRTFNLERDFIETILDEAVSDGAIAVNPASKLSRKRTIEKEDVLPTIDQLNALVSAMRANPTHTDAANVVEFLAWSGCRIGEAMKVTWADVDFAASAVRINGDPIDGTKTGKSRTLPIFKPLRALLERLHQESVVSPLFHTSRLDAALKFGRESTQFTANLTGHSFRKFFATHALQRGVDVGTVAAWLGHVDGGSLLLKTYQRIIQSHSHEQADKI